MIRGKRPEADLSHSYRKVLWGCFGLSALLHGILFAIFPGFEPDTHIRTPEPIVIQLQEIPETEQERKPPPPVRPMVPIATDNPDVPDDVTIEDTDIDLFADLPPPPPLAGKEEMTEEIKLEEEEEEIVELWKVEKKPEPVRRVTPEYPDVAWRANVTGKVVVVALIDKKGKVERIYRISGPEILREAARIAVLQWEFMPAIQNGRPVKVWVSLPFTFTLK